MSFIKKSFVWIVLIVMMGLWSYQYFVINAPCAQPIYYHLGVFDTRFNISKVDFLSAVDEATLIWEKALGKDLFSPSTEGRLDINLVYDDRQALAEKNRTLTAQVDTQKVSADAIKAQFLSLQNRLDERKKEYEALVSEFEKAQDSYNTEVRLWNRKGGAPKDEYEKLNNDKDALVAFQARVETKRLEVNALVDEINALVKKYNYLVGTVNSTISTINKDAGKEFEEGEFISDRNGERINIYEFGNHQVLVRVLAHEFGHALGLDHNDNPDSIMYYLNNSKNMKLTAEDTAAVKAVCGVE